MELAIVSKVLLEKANELDSAIPELKWYIFGSLLNVKKNSSDVDVLLIYKNVNDPKMIKFYLRDLLLSIPLDLLFMTTEEESELQFIKTQRAVKIYP